MQDTKNFGALVLACGLMIACGPPPATTSGFYDPKNAAGTVHFEEVNAHGEFTEHQALQDPMAKDYEEGLWRASRRSRVTTQATSSANRVNIVFVGDGYTATELGDYAKDVSAIQAKFLAQAPFKAYADYFSFHRVDVVSKDSGVSKATNQELKNTAMGMSYDCDGIARLLCIDLNKAMAEAQNAPAVDAVFAMANSETYGGAGYWSPAVSTFAARNTGSIELALHEFGHSFGQLTDEYDTSGVGNTCTNYANTASMNSTEMKATKTKWYRWLGTQGVDTYPGSCYSMAYYRPHFNSRMRALDNPYGAVNVEQLILKIYAKVKPIDAAATTLVTYPADSGRLWVTPMRPADHALTITWMVDGHPRAPLTGKTRVDLPNLHLAFGPHEVSVTVTDQTALVRDESARAASMTQTLTWNVQR